ncbi:MAG: hypothetical protein F6K36_10315 [Symploca sp. SIO3C6]|uniref:Uncharacterized protein n=1 Tax=Symploca sp. SIO1C4 TaxID=2607765 RepID=A0A6B3NL77_9CYAN|nr:hypothetical protein [Symploca sp. SIO3C6]NER31182.1 hypothetical protein [Symploca sp. SIO1C4]
MADGTKLQSILMSLDENKTDKSSNGLKVEVAIIILVVVAKIVIIVFWLGVGWPNELQDNFSNLLIVETLKNYLNYQEQLRVSRAQFVTTLVAILGAIGVVFNLYYTGKREEAFNTFNKSAIAANKSKELGLVPPTCKTH